MTLLWNVTEDKLALEELTGIKSTKHIAADASESTEEHPEPEENLDNVEDPNAAKKSDEDAKTKPADAPAESKKGAGDQKDEEITSPEFRKTSTLSIKSLGHPIGLRASYPKSWIRPYKVEITKPASWALSSEYHPARLASHEDK
ncbi:hypothetical protein N7540_002825 [Penicillium herquei]|nr:hypothetical protein N7540_002825 [Penicillium herquei]